MCPALLRTEGALECGTLSAEGRGIQSKQDEWFTLLYVNVTPYGSFHFPFLTPMHRSAPVSPLVPRLVT